MADNPVQDADNVAPPQGRATPQGPRRRRRLRRVLLWGLVGLLAIAVLLPAALAAGLLIWANSAPGRAWIVAEVARATAGSDAQVHIETLKPGLPGALQVQGLTIADDQGVWLTLAEARLQWNPWQLLRGTVRIDSLTGRGLTVARLPAGDTEDPAPTAPFDPRDLLPDLPVAVSVGDIDLREIVLAEAVAGMAARLDAQAHVSVTPGQGADLSIDIRRTDGVGGALTARADIVPSDDGDSLVLDLALTEPPGGLIARMAGWPATEPVNLRIDGTGPLAALDGRIAASVGGLAAVEGAFRARQDGKAERTVLVLDLDGDIAALLPADLQALAAGKLKLGLEVLAEGGGKTVTVRKLDLSTAALALSGTAALDLEGGPVSADLVVDRLDPLALQAFLPDLQLTEPRLQLTLSGSLDAPVAAMQIDAVRIGIADMALQRLSVQASARPQGPLSGADLPPVDISLDMRAAGVVQPDPAAARLLEKGLSLSLSGRLDPSAEALHVETARLALADLSLQASGDAAASGPANLRAALDIPDLAPLGGAFDLPVQGALHADLTAGGATLLAAEPGDWTAQLSARLDRIGFDDLPLQPLLGETVTLDAEATGRGTQEIALSQLRLQGAQLSATGGGRIALARNRVEGDLDLALPDLAALSGLAGTAMTGRAGLKLTLAGPLDTPGLDAVLQLDDAVLAGTPVTARLTAKAAALGMPLQMALDLQGQAMALPLSLQTDLALAGDGASLALRNLRGTVAGARLDGGLALDLDSSLADGRVNLSVADLEPLTARFGTALRGAVKGSVTLAPRPAGQGVVAEVSVDDFAMPQAAPATAAADDDPAAEAGPVLAAKSARLQADMTLAAGGPRGRLSVTLSRVQQAAATFESVTLRAEGDLAKRMQVTLAGDGKMLLAGKKQPLSLAAEAAVQGLPPNLKAELSGIRVAVGDTAVRQQGSATVTVKADVAALKGLRLDVDGGGRLTADAQSGPAAIDADIRMDSLPLALVGLFVEDVPLLGEADLAANLRLRPGRPQGKVTLKLSGLRSGKEDYQSLPPANIQAVATLEGSRLQLQADWQALGDEPGRLSLALPMRVPAGALVPEPDRKAPVSGRFSWGGDLAQLGLFLPVDSEIAGHFQADLTISGSLDAPRVPGSVQIRDGAYRNYTTGTIVTNLQARVDGGEDGRLEIAAQAGDSAGGRVNVAGHIDVSADPLPTFEMKLTTQRFVAARLDLATGSISADLTAAGTPLRNKIEGTVTVESLDVQIGGGLPPSATVMPVTVVPRPGAPPLNPREPASEPKPSRTGLDIAITIPPRMTVGGRGLDSTWSGNLTVTGSTSNPRVVGQITAVRGSFNLVGKRFNLTKGVIGFDGGRPPNPNIDIVLTYTGEQAEANVVISGTAEDPKLDLTSVPQMPEGDIISAVLFNRRSAQLSPGEALEVASSLAALTGRASPGAGITGDVRQALGLDVLSVGATSDGQPALNAGRYITDDVYVGVRQGLGSSSSSVAVQVDLTDNIQVETDVGADSNSSVGINWKYDY